MKAERLDISTVALEGANLIEASAGTGKTYAIAALYLRLLLEQGLRVQQILVVTYTRAATAELRERIRGRIRDALLLLQTGEESREPVVRDLLGRVRAAGETDLAVNRLTLALQEFDEAAVCTIHGFCQRILTENAFESQETFDAEILTDQSALVNGIAEDYWRVHCSGVSSLFADFLLTHASEFSLRVLCSLAQTLMNHQEIVVEPQGDAPDTSKLEDDYASRFHEARFLWKQSREEVHKILYTRPPLKKNSYNDKTVSKLLGGLEVMFAHKEPSLDLPEKFVLVTQSGIQTRCIAKSTPPNHPFFKACDRLEKARTQLDAAFRDRIVALKAGFAAYLIRELAERKQNRNVYGYDDMLLRVRNVLRNGNNVLLQAVRSTYTAALIDEFQDTDPVQYTIFSTLFKTPSHILFLIGDPKQAIYGFRGADIFTYMQAVNQVDRIYTMDTNWRSEPGLLEAVNRVFARMTQPFVFREIGFDPVRPAPETRGNLVVHEGIRTFFHDEFEDQPDLAAACIKAAASPLHLWFLDKETLAPNSKTDIPKETAARLVARGVAAEASRLVRMGRKGLVTVGKDHQPVEPRHLAVLVRTNRQAVMVQKALHACDLPCVIAGSGNVFQSDEAQELLRVMDGVATCGTPSRVKAALSTRMLGFDMAMIDHLEDDEDEWDRILTDFADMRDAWAIRGFMDFFSAMMTRWAVRPRLLGLEGGERMLTNVLHLMEILHGAEQEHELHMSGLLAWFAEQCNRDAGENEEHQLRLESDELAVQIVTIHKSKGLQYPIVFCPFLFDGVGKGAEVLVHDPAAGNMVLDLSTSASRERQDMAGREALAEAMRLAYVALTRAESRCYLACGRIGSGESSAMAYLFSEYRPQGDCALQELVETWKGIDNATLLQKLGKLEREIPGCAVYPMPDVPGQSAALTDLALSSRLELPRCQRVIEQRFGISSFSSLVRGQEHTARPGFDEPFEPSRETDSQEDQASFFAFPRGAGPGTMLHAVLEQLDFSLAGSEACCELIREKLQRYGMEDAWTPVVSAALHEVVSVDLGHGFSLSQVRETLPELEFHYPLQQITPQGLGQVYARWGQILPEPFPRSVEGLRFSPRKGFMLGFIDLVFRYQGKWYLVDWKSNHLGNDFQAYHKEQLVRAMDEHMYFFQSHIYTVALDAYLRMRLPDTYDYERDFGGILYVFLRGVNAKLGPEYGIYRERPDPGFVRELSTFLMGERDVEAGIA
ncbi:exodeoxyribonuclease V subunit beta [Desulfoplanes formicivorans]|uniref:DNA 3'-5' helicase n=1 Tax=Desulfoplanes formicivorans TaxID=1592317 RepID=A0A194AG63_9BACT|nr:exodeoxyribonuclease V subunit beta [Desulfoplanes formicivorans]GAU08195.1 exodeoxyribonuclease V subunit beta [Desulfoplanes formicivorans]